MQYINFTFLFIVVGCRQVSGELFAHTGKSYPFNIITNTTDNLISARGSESVAEVTQTAQPTTDTVLQRLKQKLLKYVFYDKKFF